MYKAINKELSAKNQELRISIRELRAEIIMIKAQKLEEREKTQLLKNSLKDILTKSYNEILNCLFTDEHHNVVNSNGGGALDSVGNSSTESGNKSNEKSESSTCSSRSVSKRQSFKNCFAEDPLEIDPSTKNTNNSEKVTNYDDNQTVLLKKRRRTLENCVSSPETFSVTEDLSSSFDTGQQTITYKENMETIRNVSSKSDYEINMELHTISEEGIISVESFDNSRTKFGRFLETAKNNSVTLAKHVTADNTLNESNRFGSSSCNITINSHCNLTNNPANTSNCNSMQNNDGEGLHPDNFTLFRGHTLSDSRIMGLIEAPCSTPFKSLPTDQINQNFISSESDCTFKNNDSTMKKVCVRLPRMDLNKLKDSNISKSGQIKVVTSSDSKPIKKKGTLKKQIGKSKNIAANNENYYSSDSETTSISTRPLRSTASKKILTEPSLRTKIRRN